MRHTEKQLAANALTAKVEFGGGKKGCLGVVYKNSKLRVEAGEDWVVPASQGAFPAFPLGANDDTKKKITAKFLKDEYDIQVIDSKRPSITSAIEAAEKKKAIMEGGKKKRSSQAEDD